MKKEYICDHCGKTYLAYECHIKRNRHHYCSYRCAQLSSRTKPAIFYADIRFTKYENGNQTYWRSGDGKQIRLHRLLWEEWYGPIPENYVVHHVDGNGLNNSINNLDLKEWGEHTSLHNVGKSRKRPRKPCAISECNRPSRAKGLCTMHYQRARTKERGYWL